MEDNKAVLCPKCKKSVLGIGRSFGRGRKLVTVEVHHHEDAERYNHGAATRVCKFKMTWSDSQELANKLCGDLGGRK
jgi:hypothetical protein